MKARETIATVRACAVYTLTHSDITLLVDLAEEGLSSLRALIESECVFEPSAGGMTFRDGWWDTSRVIDGTGGTLYLEPEERATITRAIAILDAAGEIERREGAPHMVRFVEGT